MTKYTYDSSGNLLAVTISNIEMPQIISQPVSVIAAPGETATFSVVVDNTEGVTFQWMLNNTNISGATGDSLLVPDITAANEGQQYSVVAINSAGSVTSAPATLRLDNDSDGLPDSWEITKFGNTTSQRSAGDPDADRISNLDEFLDGTEPNDKASLRPRLTVFTVGGGSILVTPIRLTPFSIGGGSVTITPMKLGYTLGEAVTLTPLPLPPSVFVGWAGDLAGTDNPATLTMNGNKTVRARFTSPAPLPSGLIAVWRGETNASDMIGGHHGTFFVDNTAVEPSVTPSGKVGAAFDFDGTRHIRVPDSTDLKPVQFTVEVWVFPSSESSGFRMIVAKGSSPNATSSDHTWHLGLQNRQPEFRSHENHLTSASFPIPPNEWAHLAITFDGLIERLYVNGRQVARSNELSPLIYDATPVPLTIGSDWARNVNRWHFNGRIDEVAFYNRALTPDEILSMYDADVVGKDFLQPYFTSVSQLPDGVQGADYTQQLVVILGTGLISFSLSAGVLPPGMTLSSAGLVSGVPTASGTFDFTVRATDAVGKFSEQMCVLQVFASIAAPAGIVSWWRAENDAQDAAGTNHGVLRNSPGFATGRVGQAFALDRGCIEVADSPTLRTDSLTLEAWFAFNVRSGVQVLFVKTRSIGPDFSYALWLDSGTLTGAVRDTGQPVTFRFLPVLKRWYHLAYTIDNSVKQQALYIDGIQVASRSTVSPIPYDGQPLLLGSNRESNGQLSGFFHGHMDEAAIYNRALNETEIKSIFNAGAAGKHL
jgi:hypothetical protein